MILNRFRLRIIIQTVVIAVLGVFSLYLFAGEHLWLTRLTAAGVWIFLLVNLINYTSRTNKRLNNFLTSLRFLDTLPGNDDSDRTFRELNLSLNEIISRIKEAEKEKETQSVYFRSTVEHISTGLISFNEQGKVTMYNRAARQLLEKPVLPVIHELDGLKKGLAEKLLSLPPGESFLSAVVIRGQLHRIIFRKAIIKIHDEQLSVLSLQDIRSQLEEEELETWQKLIRILRHEIMNSVAPLNSLSISLRKIVERTKKDIPEKEGQMLVDGLEVISRRSEGLMKFVKAYKTLTTIPKPKFSDFPATGLLEDCATLFKPDLEKNKIHLHIEGDQNILLTADYDLISQVIINLIRNAAEAIEHPGGIIRLKAEKNDPGIVVIKVEDNGSGIPEDRLEDIFMPFYTTRENGSGIGLSLARQIMRIHKGNIRVMSEEGKGTKFILDF